MVIAFLTLEEKCIANPPQLTRVVTFFFFLYLKLFRNISNRLGFQVVVVLVFSLLNPTMYCKCPRREERKDVCIFRPAAN